MKKTINLVALIVMLSVNVLTPISYAQSDDGETSEHIDVVIQSETQWSEESGEWWTWNEADFSSQVSQNDNDVSTWTEGEGSSQQEVDFSTDFSEWEDDVQNGDGESVEDLPEVVEDKLPSLIDMVVDEMDNSWINGTEEFDKVEEGISSGAEITEELNEWDWDLLQEDWYEKLLVLDGKIEILDVWDRQSNLSEDFKWWEITIYDQNDPTNSITIMDRNLWAITDDITSTGSYGYYYQWWNNYWFSADCYEYWCTVKEDTTGTKIERNNLYDDNWYYWENFVLLNSSSYRSDGTNHASLWWWEEDNENNNRWLDGILETQDARQWPCPDWWHVPSIWEWNKLLEYYTKLLLDGSITYNYNEWLLSIHNYSFWSSFLKYFSIPLGGTLSYDNGNLESLIQARFWSSSPNWLYFNGLYVESDYYYKYITSTQYKWLWGNSLRCFKNYSWSQSESPVIVSFYVDWEESPFIQQYIDVWNRPVEPNMFNWLETDKMFGSWYMVWYTDSDYTTKYDFSQPVMSNINLYGKWIESVKHEDWLIKITNWDKTIYVKDRNQWATKTVVMDKKQRLDDLLDHEMGMLAEQKWLQSYRWRSDNELVALAIQKAQDIVGHYYTISTLADIDSFYNIYNPYKDVDYTASFWDYYFRWNNNWIKFNQLNVNNCWYDSCDTDLSDLEYIGWKLWDEETWWEVWNIDNPCDASAWEYLPTVDDWKEVMDLWATVAHDKQNEYTYKPVYNETPNYYEYYFRQWDDVVEHFRTDFMIPKAWYLYNDTFWFDPDLWTAIDDNYMVWYASEWYLQYSTKEDALSWFNESASPVRCFVLGKDVIIVQFNLDWGEWNIEQQKVMYKIQEPESIPTKAWYTFAWWYTSDWEKWDFEKDRVEEDMTLYAKWRLCGEWFTVKGNKCVPNDMSMKWIIEVSDGVDTMYIKDRNVWAKISWADIYGLIEDECRLSYTDWWHCVEFTEVDCSNLDTYTEYVCPDEIYDQISDIVKVKITDSDGLKNYLKNYPSSFWDYYFRWNNNGVNYNDLEIDEDGMIKNVDDLLEEWFNGWKLWNSEWNGWIEWNEQDNPCNGDWEYLPTPEDWIKLITIWANKNGYEIEVYDDGNWFWMTGWNNFMGDLMMPYAWNIRHNDDYYRYDYPYYMSALSKNGNVSWLDDWDYW